MVGVDLAARIHSNRVDGVAVCEVGAGIGRAAGQGTGCTTAHIRLEVGSGGSIAGGLLVFQSPLLLGSVNLAEVVDASVLLSLGAGANEVRDGDRSQETDDGDDDHDFDQGEARFACVVFHTICFYWFLFARRERSSGLVNFSIAFCRSLIARCRPRYRLKQGKCQITEASRYNKVSYYNQQVT